MPAVAQKPQAFERGEMLYLVAPLVPHQPTAQEIEEYAFGRSVIDNLRNQAPNENIAWFGGHYVEADRPNLNGAMWLGEDLAIASLTPVMMPVTVMHDPRTAVGVIAHQELQLPGESAVPRAKIDTALALWRHRFPEAVEEAQHNYQQGTLMQSMECLAPRYECSECRMPFVKLPKGAEQAMWCEHLKASHPSGGYNAAASGESSNASRILRGVTFTGTGLIFGSRGAQGADPSANLEAFQEEVAEFHSANRDTRKRTPRPTRSKRKMELDDTRYAELLAAEQKAKDLDTKIPALEATAAKVPDLEQKVTTLEAEKASAEEAKTAAEAKVTEFEEKANKQTLRDQRWGALGSAFTAKLDAMPTTKGNLLAAAAEMEESAWDARLKEVEEATDVKRDARKDGEGEGKEGEDANKNNPIFSKEETARFQGGGGGGSGAAKQPTAAERGSVMRGLVKPKAAKSGK